MKDYKKKNVKLYLVILFVALIVLVGITYAAASQILRGSKNVLMTVGNIQIVIDQDTPNTISLTDGVPVSDSEGITSSPYEFNIINNGNKAVYYDIYLENDTTAQANCTKTKGSTCELIAPTSISYQLIEADKIVSTGSLSSTSNLLYNLGGLDKNTGKTYQLRIWLNTSATTADTNKYYFGRLRLDAKELMEEKTAAGEVTTFDYTGSPQIFVASRSGPYQIEVWGAEGGYRSSATYAGKGGYSKGTITLNKDTRLIVMVGGSGNSGTCSNNICVGGYNGGGYRYMYKGGGGATDVRLENSNYARFIVAGGGGSDGGTTKKGMYGGGTTGGSSTESYTAISNYGGKGGTQTYSGYSAAYTAPIQAVTNEETTTTKNYQGGFGFGGFGIFKTSGYGGAGGGGWYGGSGNIPDTSGDDDRGGGGGSGFVWTEVTASNVPSGYLVPSIYYLQDAVTLGGNQSIPNKSGSGTSTGNAGNGYVKITYLGR